MDAETKNPVITVLKIKYKDGFKEECMQWMLETGSIVYSFDGFVEKNVCISIENEREILNIFTFSNQEYLQRWENSKERMIQTKKGEKFVEVINQKSHLTALGFMFPTVTPPKRWKMVVITICVIFILLNSLVPILQQVFTILQLPMLLKSLLGVAIMVSLMTFAILPFLSKILGRWLVK